MTIIYYILLDPDYVIVRIYREKRGMKAFSYKSKNESSSLKRLSRLLKSLPEDCVNTVLNSDVIRVSVG